MGTVTRGVAYYNRGTRCLVRLLVSLHSLRAHYDGPVAILNEGGTPGWFRAVAGCLNASILVLAESTENVLLAKSRLAATPPFGATMFLDSDTLVRQPVDQFLAWTEEHGAVVTRFNEWHTHRGRMRRRIEQWRKAAPELVDKALAYGGAINTGVMGWTEGHPLLKAYAEVTERGLKAGGVSRKIVDEIAMQLAIPHHPHKLAPSEWNVGCLHGRPEGAAIIHYHGRKHCREGRMGDLWKAEYLKLREQFPTVREITTGGGDPDLTKWLRETGRRKDMTVVTAVNPAYAERAKANLAKWMETPGLKEQRFLVFVNGFRNAAERKWLEQWPNVKVVRWDYPHPAASPREVMLAAFVLGTAEHVKTKFWMKLDADTAPTKGRFEWPEYDRHDVVSHKWGFTKMKHDPGAKSHWFHTLDRALTPENRLFLHCQLDPVADLRVSHRKGNKCRIPMRFASFAHIERTELTKEVAARIREACGGRLPVPSHDTIVWHWATAHRKKVRLVNMKEWFQP
jgi:hypothetical protein